MRRACVWRACGGGGEGGGRGVEKAEHARNGVCVCFWHALLHVCMVCVCGMRCFVCLCVSDCLRRYHITPHLRRHARDLGRQLPRGGEDQELHVGLCRVDAGEQGEEIREGFACVVVGVGVGVRGGKRGPR